MFMTRRTMWALSACLAVTATGLRSMAQEAITAPLNMQTVKVAVDSGRVENTGQDVAVVFSTVVSSPGATWLRMHFNEAVLAGSREAGNASYLRITSLADGAFQILDNVSIRQWRLSSAYMNGDTVEIELFAHPNTGSNRVSLRRLSAGMPGTEESICGTVDNRELSDSPRDGRMVPVGCSVWIIDDAAHCFLTAGHCGVGANQTIEFNVPLSNGGGGLLHPGPEDQYAVDPESVQGVNGGVGNDYGYFGCFPNSNTGLTPFEAQGDFYVLAENSPPVQGQTIRITGYGTVSPPVSPTWNQVQKTHTGPYAALFGSTVQYSVDTTGGNSGSPVFDENSQTAIGIHTHGGCNVGGGANQGTAIHNAGLQNALANPRGVCLPTFGYEYPDGQPSIIAPDTAAVFAVNAVADTAMPVPGTGMLHYSLDGDPFVAVAMQHLGENAYIATLPPASCGASYRWYVSAESEGGNEVTDPVNAPTGAFGAIIASGLDPSFEDDFETNKPWVIFGTAQDGVWERAVPTDCGLGDPGADFDGSGRCYVTGNACNSDVDTGQTYLVSPRINLNGGGAISFAYWLNDTPGQPMSAEDYLSVQLATDQFGTNWQEVRRYSQPAAMWRTDTLIVDSETATNSMRIRFIANDTGAASVVEAAIDAVVASRISCEQNMFAVPESFEVLRGMLIDGNLADLAASDNNRMSINAGITLFPGEAPVMLLLDGTSTVASPSSLSFLIEATSSTPGVNQVIELFNYQTQEFEIIDERVTTPTEQTVTIDVNGDLDRFIEAGTQAMQARLNWYPPVLVLQYPWSVSIDQSVWQVAE